MSSTFSRTIRSLKIDGSRRRTAKLFVATALLAAWVTWFVFGRIALYEVSESAQLQVTSEARPITTRVAGQIIQTRLELGRHVQLGEVLVELDDRAARLAFQESRARSGDCRSQMAAIEKEIEAEAAAAEAFRKAAAVALEESRALIDEAQAPARYAERNAARLKQLLGKGAITDDEVLKAESEAEQKRAKVHVLEVAVSRLEENQKVEARDRLTRVEHLQSELAEFSGKIPVLEAAARRSKHDVELCKVCSPVTGRVGEVEQRPAGSSVEAGELLGYVVPDSEPITVAYFPESVAGRVREGQTARIRLEGFPWTQYGSIPATVTKVANEPRDGQLRVELQLSDSQDLPMPVEHGLPGSTEVLVERISPAVLVLRTAGWFLSADRQ